MGAGASQRRGHHRDDDEPMGGDGAEAIKQGWLLKRGSRQRPVATGYWKQRYFQVLADGRLRYYKKDWKLRHTRWYMQKKELSLALCDVDTRRYTPVEDPLQEITVIVLSILEHHVVPCGNRVPRKVGELQVVANPTWLKALREQVTTAKNKIQEQYIEGYETLRSLLTTRQASRQSSYSGRSKASKGGSYTSSPTHTGTPTHHGNPQDTTAALATLRSDLRENYPPSLRWSQISIGAALGYPPVRMPRLHIVVMAVGTWGDVQPFMHLCHRLHSIEGHHVRLATHEKYREKVQAAGFGFYPLAGDPEKLSAYMVQSEGNIIPSLDQESLKLLPEKIAMVKAILESTWPACTAPDPEDPLQTPFRADAIISNPVTYGHIHCAEALGVPLHLMFPQPWSPTRAFPHPLSGLSYSRDWVWTRTNLASYTAVETFQWLGIERMVNAFRKKLGLPGISRGEAAASLVVDNEVPFVKMWSPSFVPKPSDWGTHIDVAGFFLEEKTEKEQQHTEEEVKMPEAEAGPGHDLNAIAEQDSKLAEWLRQGDPPVLIGFGSMKIEEEDAVELVDKIVEAAHKAHVRVLLQSGWTDVSEYVQGGDRAVVYPIGRFPHTLLMPQMAAVVHHGGAGTTAAGLMAAKPTFVCPFFGDQFFWGEMVERAGVGPAPVPIKDVTVESFVNAFRHLKDPEVIAKTQALCAQLRRENGVRAAAEVFKTHMPVEDLVCDVSLFQDETRVAKWWCASCGLKLSDEADRVIHGNRRRHHKRTPYKPMLWGVVGPRDVIDGVVQGTTGLLREVATGVVGLVEEPVRGALDAGCVGAMRGLMTGVVHLVAQPMLGVLVFCDKVAVGVCNQAEQAWDEDLRRRRKQYIFVKPSFKDVRFRYFLPVWSSKDKDRTEASTLRPQDWKIYRAFLLARAAQRVYKLLSRRGAPPSRIFRLAGKCGGPWRCNGLGMRRRKKGGYDQQSSSSGSTARPDLQALIKEAVQLDPRSVQELKSALERAGLTEYRAAGFVGFCSVFQAAVASSEWLQKALAFDDMKDDVEGSVLADGPTPMELGIDAKEDEADVLEHVCGGKNGGHAPVPTRAEALAVVTAKA